MGTLKPQSNGPLYSNTVIGTLAVGGLLHLVQRGGAWASCGPAHPLLAVPNVTAHPQWRRQDFFLGGLGPFPLRSLSSLPSLSPPLPFPSSLSSTPSLPSPPLKTRRQTGRAPLPSPPLPCLPLSCPPVPSLSLPLEVGPLNPARGSGGAL